MSRRFCSNNTRTSAWIPVSSTGVSNSVNRLSRVTEAKSIPVSIPTLLADKVIDSLRVRRL